MSVAYVDSSVLVALAVGEPTRPRLERRLGEFSTLLSSNLLEAELRSALSRERRTLDRALFAGIEWVLPDRPLTSEFEAVLAAGYLRGADLWHVAAALFATHEPGSTAFLTLDRRQRAVAEALGFAT